MSALDPSAQALPIVGADVGFSNPMTATGDLIVGGASGVASRLAIGATGTVPRVIGGTVAWRDLIGAGLLADRPAASADRKGQWYWSTDAAAGLELAQCVHKGAIVYAWEVVPYGVTATGVALAQAASVAAARAAIGAAATADMPWSSTLAPATVQTTDATTTTLATIATTTNKGHALDLLVSATQSDRSAQIAWRVLATITNVAGACTVRDVLISASDGGVSAWAVAVDVSGTNIRVRVTGAGGTTIDWCGAGAVLVHGS